MKVETGEVEEVGERRKQEWYGCRKEQGGSSRQETGR